jgi:hypothetical protein
MRAFSPRSVAAGVDVWTWLLSERPSVEMALLTEIVAAWTWTIKKRKGLFSTALKYVLLFHLEIPKELQLIRFYCSLHEQHERPFRPPSRILALRQGTHGQVPRCRPELAYAAPAPSPDALESVPGCQVSGAGAYGFVLARHDEVIPSFEDDEVCSFINPT